MEKRAEFTFQYANKSSSRTSFKDWKTRNEVSEQTDSIKNTFHSQSPQQDNPTFNRNDSVKILPWRKALNSHLKGSDSSSHQLSASQTYFFQLLFHKKYSWSVKLLSFLIYKWRFMCIITRENTKTRLKTILLCAGIQFNALNKWATH